MYIQTKRQPIRIEQVEKRISDINSKCDKCIFREVIETYNFCRKEDWVKHNDGTELSCCGENDYTFIIH